MNTNHIISLIATLLTGLIAGLFYAYSCSVNKGLHALADAEYMRAMQSINRKILNAWFFMSFLGTLLLLPVSSYLQYKTGNTAAFQWALAATVVYATGVFGITMAGNVPLNIQLDRFDWKIATAETICLARSKFESPWNKLNLLRTIFSILAFAMSVLAIIKSK